MKNLEKIRQTFTKDELEIVAVNTVDRTDSAMSDWIKNGNKTFQFLFEAFELSKKLQIEAYPTTFIYNTATKEIIFFHRGSSAKYADFITDFLRKRL
jgi:hypothetical protein